MTRQADPAHNAIDRAKVHTSAVRRTLATAGVEVGRIHESRS